MVQIKRDAGVVRLSRRPIADERRRCGIYASGYFDVIVIDATLKSECVHRLAALAEKFRLPLAMISGRDAAAMEYAMPRRKLSSVASSINEQRRQAFRQWARPCVAASCGRVVDARTALAVC